MELKTEFRFAYFGESQTKRQSFHTISIIENRKTNIIIQSNNRVNRENSVITPNLYLAMVSNLAKIIEKLIWDQKQLSIVFSHNSMARQGKYNRNNCPR